jgi:hypothetical protein
VALDLLALGHSLFGRACTRAMWPMPLIGSPSPGTGWTPAAVLWALAQAQAERGTWDTRIACAPGLAGVTQGWVAHLVAFPSAEASSHAPEVNQ